MKLLWIMVWSTMAFSMVIPWAVRSDPIKIDFNTCQNATYHTAPSADAPVFTVQCCPPKPTRAIIDGVPPPSTTFTRVRQASQCTDATYAAKLEKAYALMRALPDDDPRSFTQQWHLHCSYCGGSFFTSNSSGIPEGIDIHFSWLFFPWHRLYLFFHERILQSLLGDPTFSLNYWNWDSPFTVGDGSSQEGACLIAGADFPAIFSDSSKSTYDANRSENAKGNGRLHFPDLTFLPSASAVNQTYYGASAQNLTQVNLNVMYEALVSGGTTAETFMGRPYRAGDSQGNPLAGGGGTLENTAHAGAHFWTGRDPPVNTNDMGELAYASRDPIFYAHHSNIDRLWQVWKSIGPLLGQDREYYTDPDFLNAEFLFYDENKDLRRVHVSDALSTENLGYAYQQANDAAWIDLNQTRCSNLDYSELIAQAEALPVPTQDSNGYYQLQGGTPFTIVIDRPENPHGAEEFLSIGGIKLDRSRNGGFDVFVDLLYPSNYTSPWSCAEYSGRFMNMAQSEECINGNQQYLWKESITRTLVDIQAPEAPSKLVITLLEFSQFGSTDGVSFNSISVTTGQQWHSDA